MGLAGVIGSFATGIYAVTRTVAATRGSDGRVIAGATSVVNIEASIQPLTGQELKALPEGHHAENLRKMYAQEAMYTRTPSNDPDQVSFGGENWEVLNVQSWEAFGLGSGGDHWEATIARITTP